MQNLLLSLYRNSYWYCVSHSILDMVSCISYIPDKANKQIPPSKEADTHR